MSGDAHAPAAEQAALEARLASLDLVTVRVDVGGRLVPLRKPRSAEALISEADFAADERLPYWADVWPSSRALGGVLQALDGRGRRLLELGCGAGLVATVALHAGFDVVATDYYDDALAVARLNALHLGPDAARRLAVRLVDWRAMPSDLGRFDVVCAADVLYEPEYATLVAAAIDVTLAEGGTAWIADPGRLAWSRFADAMHARGFTETERLTAVIASDPDAGDLASAARPGETVGGRHASAAEAEREAADGGRPPLAHRVTVTAWRRGATPGARDGEAEPADR